MSLSTEDRLRFCELMSALGPDREMRALLAFAREHRAELFAEAGDLPGMAQVRAGVVRLLPYLELDAAKLAELVAAAGTAVMTPVEAGPGLLLRQPAWMGLCVMELADVAGWADGVSRAVQVAGEAFSVATPIDDVAPGEVLWAMAERADEVQWHMRASALLEVAAEEAFQDPAGPSKVRLLLALRRLEGGQDASDLLDVVVSDPSAVGPTRVHAAWVLGHLKLEGGDIAACQRAWQLALAEVDEHEDADVAERLRTALAGLDT